MSLDGLGGGMSGQDERLSDAELQGIVRELSGPGSAPTEEQVWPRRALALAKEVLAARASTELREARDLAVKLGVRVAELTADVDALRKTAEERSERDVADGQ